MQIYSPILYTYQSSTFHVHERYQLQGSSEVSWSVHDISVEYIDIFCSVLDNCQLIIEWLSSDYQATIKGLPTDMTTAISTIILTLHYLQ